MYQESDDRIKGTALKDTVLFIILIAAFFVIGGIVTAIKAKLDNNIPIYVFAALAAVCVYLIYRLRIVGYRYTVFYKEPEPEYDPRFDDYITHEDYPYPVGTFVVERTVSAKGEIIDAVSADSIIAFLEPGSEYAGVDEELVCCSHRKAVAHSLVYKKDGRVIRMYICPSDELKGYINTITEGKAE